VLPLQAQSDAMAGPCRRRVLLGGMGQTVDVQEVEVLFTCCRPVLGVHWPSGGQCTGHTGRQHVNRTSTSCRQCTSPYGLQAQAAAEGGPCRRHVQLGDMGQEVEVLEVEVLFTCCCPVWPVR
jgi:hypothetical protein